MCNLIELDGGVVVVLRMLMLLCSNNVRLVAYDAMCHFVVGDVSQLMIGDAVVIQWHYWLPIIL